MSQTQIESILIRLLYLAGGLIVVFQGLGSLPLVSLCFTATFFLVVLLWLCSLIRGIDRMDALTLVILGLSLLSVALNAWQTGTPMSFGYLKKLVMFICTVIFFQCAHKLRPDRAAVRFLGWLLTGLSLFLVGYYFLEPRYTFFMNRQIAQYLTFRFTNPNLCALFLLCLYMAQLLLLLDASGKGRRFFHGCVAGTMLYFLYRTQSRNALLAAITVTGIYLLILLRRSPFRISAWYALPVAVLPLVFVFIYVAVIDNEMVRDMFAFMDSEGKELNTRLVVWLPALEHFADSPLIGAYSQISEGTGMSQMHNSHLDVLAGYGAPVLVLVCVLLFLFIRGHRDSVSRHNTAARIFFSGTLLIGLGEAALFSGGLGIYIFAGLFLLLTDPGKQPQGEARP